MEFNIHHNAKEFERLLCEYTGAPFAIAVDNCCNALFLCLRFCKAEGKIKIPAHTYIGVPYAIRAAHCEPEAVESTPELTGAYQLAPYPIYDSALRFTSGMYEANTFQCLSFTGPYKHLKLGKAGAILTDNPYAYEWLKKARFSGRSECSYHVDTFTMPEGYNYYLAPQIATLGAHLLPGIPQHNTDLTLPYPDWSKHPAFTYTYTYANR
jgi:dTDP-4-amino-4,6-dideoxygalactose transaminase